MPPSLNPGQTQPEILRTYTALHQFRPVWGGALILSLGLDSQGAALSIAANIAGAVSLAIDNNPTHLREVARTGAADFVVNTLDEAIRAMKNEVRKQAPLSVALNSDPVQALKEILERGLVPQLFTNFLPQDECITEAATHLQSLGAALIDFNRNTPHGTPPPRGFRSSQTLLEPFLRERAWQLHTISFDDIAALRAFDARALSLLPREDTLRRRWLESAPRILQRQRSPQRSLWLTEAEAHALGE